MTARIRIIARQRTFMHLMQKFTAKKKSESTESVDFHYSKRIQVLHVNFVFYIRII